MRRISILITVVLALYIACSWQADKKHFMKVEKGKFSSTIMETGGLQAVNSTAIFTPFEINFIGQLKIIYLEKEGTQVKKGQIVGEIEKTKVIQELEKKKSDLAMAQSNIEKLKVEHKTRIKQLQAELLTKEASLKSAQINTQRVKFESTTAKEIAKLKLEKAEIDFKKIKRKIESTKIVQYEELKINETKIKQINSEIQSAKRAIDTYTLRAPTNGIIEYCRNLFTGNKVQVGDQLYPMFPVIALPDLSQMKVITSVNEMDISKIYIKQKVYVRLDAFPKKVFVGSIIKLSNVSHIKDRESKIKVFDVEVLLDRVDPILRPGMTVSCEFVVAELDEALFVDNVCIHQEGEEYFVYVDSRHGIRPVKITLGPRNNKAVVVYGDLKAGDKVAVAQELRKK